MATVTFRDETATGRRLEEFSIPDLPETMTVRELVRLRVREKSPATTRGRRTISTGSSGQTTPRSS